MLSLCTGPWICHISSRVQVCNDSNGNAETPSPRAGAPPRFPPSSPWGTAGYVHNAGGGLPMCQCCPMARAIHYIRTKAQWKGSAYSTRRMRERASGNGITGTWRHDFCTLQDTYSPARECVCVCVSVVSVQSLEDGGSRAAGFITLATEQPKTHRGTPEPHAYCADDARMRRSLCTTASRHIRSLYTTVTGVELVAGHSAVEGPTPSHKGQSRQA